MPQSKTTESPPLFVCTSCGTQYAASETPPARCLLCDEEGWAPPVDGPAWTTLDEIARRHENIVQRLEEDLFSVRTMPRFPTGQRAMIVRSASGNVLWDCLTLIDEPTRRIIRALGGLTAIAVSHPRYYASVVEWSYAFGGVPIYLNASGRRWLMRPDPVVEFWEGQRLHLHDGITLTHSGGYAGGTILHWPAGAGGRGVLLTGDVVQVVPERDRVSFLSSSAGLVPRSARAVRRIESAITFYAFERLYDATPDRVITRNARDIAIRSVAEYVAAVFDLHGERNACAIIDPRLPDAEPFGFEDACTVKKAECRTKTWRWNK